MFRKRIPEPEWFYALLLVRSSAGDPAAFCDRRYEERPPEVTRAEAEERERLAEALRALEPGLKEVPGSWDDPHASRAEARVRPTLRLVSDDFELRLERDGVWVALLDWPGEREGAELLARVWPLLEVAADHHPDAVVFDPEQRRVLDLEADRAAVLHELTADRPLWPRMVDLVFGAFGAYGSVKTSLLVLACFALAAFGAWKAGEAVVRNQTWERVPGEVTSTEVAPERSNFAVRVRYAFAAVGADREGLERRVVSDRERADAIAAEHAAGTAVLVRHAPGDPSRSRLQPESTVPGLFMLVAFGALGLYGLRRIRRRLGERRAGRAWLRGASRGASARAVQ